MKKRIVITICALCLSLFVPAALAEETIPDTDAITSAAQQQDRPSRGEMPQAPDQNSQEAGRNRPEGQKHSRNGQMPKETAPAPQGSMPEQDLQIPDSNGQQPDPGDQQKHAAGKTGRGNRQKKQANSQTEELQSENSQPVFPEAPFPDDNPESAADWITRLEKMIDELNQMLESLNAKTVPE